MKGDSKRPPARGVGSPRPVDSIRPSTRRATGWSAKPGVPNASRQAPRRRSRTSARFPTPGLSQELADAPRPPRMARQSAITNSGRVGRQSARTRSPGLTPAVFRGSSPIAARQGLRAGEMGGVLPLLEKGRKGAIGFTPHPCPHWAVRQFTLRWRIAYHSRRMVILYLSEMRMPGGA